MVGRFDARAPDARVQLRGWLKQKGMLGVRMSFHVKPFIDWLDVTVRSIGSGRNAMQLALPISALVPGMVESCGRFSSGTQV